MWLIKHVEDEWVVGYFQPDGSWYTFDTFKYKDYARDEVNYLNGGPKQ
jgi:hypothetical protein